MRLRRRKGQFVRYISWPTLTSLLIPVLRMLANTCSLCYRSTAQCNQALLEDRLPFSYSHLLFSPTLVRFPPDGLGEVGSENKLADVLPLKGLPDPIDDRRPFPKLLFPKLLTLFWKRGLPRGEPVLPCTIGLPRPDRGELL